MKTVHIKTKKTHHVKGRISLCQSILVTHYHTLFRKSEKNVLEIRSMKYCL